MRASPHVTRISIHSLQRFRKFEQKKRGGKARFTAARRHGTERSGTPDVLTTYFDTFQRPIWQKDQSNQTKTVAAAALRISFKTDRPLFPYREPDPRSDAGALGTKDRLLRIYFIAEARYRGELTKDNPWTGSVVWADKLKPHARKQVLELLKLPADIASAAWWLTEFEDRWPYEAAPADVYFSADPNQQVVHRPPVVRYYVSVDGPCDGSLYALAAVMLTPCLVRRVRRRS